MLRKNKVHTADGGKSQLQVEMTRLNRQVGSCRWVGHMRVGGPRGTHVGRLVLGRQKNQRRARRSCADGRGTSKQTHRWLLECVHDTEHKNSVRYHGVDANPARDRCINHYRGGGDSTESSTSDVPMYLDRKEAQRIVVACLLSKAGSWETVTELLQQNWVSDWDGWQELQRNMTEEMSMCTATRLYDLAMQHRRAASTISPSSFDPKEVVIAICLSQYF